MRLILTGAERWPSCRGRPKLWTITLTHEGNSWQRAKWFRLCLNTNRHSYTFIHHWLQCLFAKLDQYSGGLQEKHFLKTCYFILVFLETPAFYLEVLWGAQGFCWKRVRTIFATNIPNLFDALQKLWYSLYGISIA